jgi:predicted secreted protein
MWFSTRLAAAVLAVTPVAGAEKPGVVPCADASEADHGTTIWLASGMELAVALPTRPGSGCRWRLLQYDSSVLQGLGAPEVRFEPKPGRKMVGFLCHETFRFRARRAGESGVAFGYFTPRQRTPPDKQVRILVRTG